MKTLKILTIAAIIIAASAFAVNNVFEGGEASNSSENGYDIGDVATDFKLKNIDGKQVSLSDYSTAKGFIVVFTTNHCPYAKAYENRIVALDKKYKTHFINLNVYIKNKLRPSRHSFPPSWNHCLPGRNFS